MALALDGIAEVRALAAEYASRGAAGLVSGAEPYALILADPARGALVLARNGDGPPLYYAETAGGVLAASEPGALLAAGVPAEPDEGMVARFIATGACDDTAATFYAGIRRVLPGEVVEIAGGTRTRKPVAARDGAGRFARSVLDAAIGRGRIGVRFGHGLAGAAAVGAALTGPEGRRTLTVYSASFPGLTTAHATHSLLPPLREVLVRMRGELAGALLDPLLPGARRPSWDALAALFGGGQVEAGAVFRRYMVERWLRTLSPARPARRPQRTFEAEAKAGGAQWTRVPLSTEVFSAGDKLPEKVAWYVSECLAGLGRKAYRRARWHVLLAARPVAVVQGRVRPVWEIRPGAAARALHRWARPAAGLHDPWTAQVVVERVGPLRAAVGPAAVHGVRGPRPGGVAVVLPPEEPARVAADVLAALRTALPEEAYATLGGCAVVGAAGVAGVAGELDAALAAELCEDDPLATHPIAVVLSGSPARKGERRNGPARSSRTAGRK
ncbi:hypothetical protein Psuf_024240 [Phytohabitans suffuscus]|uniref:Uncharacterized protein n=1 Tax=Phytohabitans suffuscus TaxID=624315 RepID=A0A6F8YGN8_9ACTN|nr:hypothetical protein Psuf_024240 [Phytohabitans suffuscus]